MGILATLADGMSFIGTLVIAAYATHQAIIVLFGRARDWMEAAAGLGGILFLLGVYLTGSRVLNDSYVIANGLQVFGVGLMFLPRVVRITFSALRPL